MQIAQTNAAFPATFILRNVDNSPHDLSDADDIRMQFKSAPGTDAELTASLNNGILSRGVDPTLGNLSLLIPTGIMETISPATYFFDALKLIGAERYLLFRGLWRVLAGITDDLSSDLPPLPGTVRSGNSIVITAVSTSLQVMLSGGAPSSLLPITQRTEPAAQSGALLPWYDTVNGVDVLKIKFPSGRNEIVAYDE